MKYNSGKYYYRLFGLTIESVIELPELHSEPATNPDVRIVLGKVDEHLKNPQGSGFLYEVAPNDFIFRFHEIGRFRVQQGETITIQPFETASPDEVRLFLFGSSFGALLHQRGILPLHGSAINTKDGAMIFVGFSSVGKSTIAAQFATMGYEVLADDIVPVSYENLKYIIHPGIPYLKLWKDVIDDFNLTESLEKVRPALEKYKLPVFNKPKSESYGISKIVVLETHNKPNTIIEEVKGSSKFKYIKTHTYRGNYIHGLGLSEAHFQKISDLARKIKIYKVIRPISPMMVKDLSNLIEEKLVSK